MQDLSFKMLNSKVNIMPSCAIVKVENKTSTEVQSTATPIRQVLVIIEHKIRNLEKRKSKLESYKELEKSGKDMTNDQKLAASKYEEVSQNIEFARELSKLTLGIIKDTEKEHRKQFRKDFVIRIQQESSKIRDVLIIQDTMEHLKDERVRLDFINGTNGACKIEPEELDILEKLYNDITPKRELATEEENYSVLAQKSAEHFLSLVDSRGRIYEDTTYAKLNLILKNINSCEYFDKKKVEIVTTTNDENMNTEQSEPPIISDEIENETLIIQNNNQQIHVQPTLTINNNIPENSNVQVRLVSEAPAPKSVPTPSFPPQQIAPQIVPSSQIPPTQVLISPMMQPAQGGQVTVTANVPVPNQIQPAHLGPTTVRAVEQAYFKQHQYIQQMRPINEVIESGSFFFLQDSELDGPDAFPVSFQAVPPSPQPSITNSVVQPIVAQQQQQQQQVSVQPPQPTVVQSNPPPQQQQNSLPSGISTQTFTNQNFKTIVPQQQAVYTTPEITSAHIPGFATTNSPIPVTIQTLTPLQVQQQQQQQQQQQTPQQQNQIHIIAPVPTVIPGFVSPQQFPLSAGGTGPTILAVQMQQQQQATPAPMQKESVQIITEGGKAKQQQIDLIVKKMMINQKEQQQQMPPIENWNDSGKDESMEWHDGNSSSNRNNNDSKEWNANDNKQNNNNESNTWTSDSQNQMSDNYGSSGRGYGRGSRGGRGGGGSRGGPPSGGYRGRSNNSYQSNGGSGAGRSSGNGGNTFYRNNDNNYYQNGGYNNTTRQDGNGGSGGGGNSGYSNGTYKPRGSSTSGSSIRGGGSTMRPTNNNNNNGNNTDRPPRNNDSNNMTNNRNSGNIRSTTTRGTGGGGNNGNSGGNGGGSGYVSHRTPTTNTTSSTRHQQQSVNINA